MFPINGLCEQRNEMKSVHAFRCEFVLFNCIAMLVHCVFELLTRLASGVIYTAKFDVCCSIRCHLHLHVCGSSSGF